MNPTHFISKPGPQMDTVTRRGEGWPQRNWAWIWVAYTGFLFLEPIFNPSRWMWVGSLAVFTLFLGIFAGYLRSARSGSAVRFWMIGVTFLLGMVTFPWNPGASCLFIYAASFLPFCIERVPRVLALIFAEMLCVLAEGRYFTTTTSPQSWLHVGWVNTVIAVFLIIVIGGGNIFLAQQKRSDCQLQAAQEENLALAAVAERERIARDLHDVLGHTLSVIVLKAELAGRLLNHATNADPVRAAAEIADVERTARTALADVREAIGGYRARGLAAEIETARRTLDAAGVTLLAESGPASSAGLSAAEETVLSLALREAVTNIVRHARATTCRLRFVSEQGRRRLVVEDDGAGTTASDDAMGGPREGNGLRGMRERVEALGGRLKLEQGFVSGRDAERRGTRLLIDLPLQAQAAGS